MAEFTLTDERKKILTAFLRRNLDEASPALTARAQKVASYVRQWEAKSTKKNWPWPGASSIRAPMTAIVRDSIVARFLNSLQGQDRDINVEPVIDKELPLPNPANPKKNLRWRDFTDRQETYMLYEASENGQFDFRGYQNDLVEESTMTGTGFSKWWWEDRVTRDAETGSDILSFSNVRARVNKLENMIFPRGYDSLDRIPFIGEKYTLRPSEMLQNIDALNWNPSEVRSFLAAHMRDEAERLPADVEQDDTEMGDGSFGETGEIWLVESWIRIAFPRKDSEVGGREMRLLVDHPLNHPEFIFRVEAWPYEHGELPYPDPTRYITRRGKLLGMGIPERASGLDEALSTTLNQIIDAATIGNVPVWSVDQNVKSIQNLDAIWPGRVIYRDENDSAIVPLHMGGPDAAIFEGYNLINRMLEQVTKVSDFNLGRESSVTGAEGSTATTTLALLAESGKYFDAIERSHRKHINAGLWRWMMMLGQFQPLDRLREVLGDEDATILSEVWKLPPDQISKRISVKVAFSDSAASRELARQEEMAKYQLLEAYYRALIEMAQLLVESGGLFKPLLDQIAESADRKMRMLLERFGESFANTNLPDWQQFSDVAIQMIQQQAAQEIQGEVPQEDANA